jgi:glyoxylase I family protein
MRALHIGAEGGVSEILGVDHIYLTVSDFARSEKFYDRVMKAIEFKKGTTPIGGEPHCHYFNRNLQISIRPARERRARYDSYAPGLHHLCLRVTNNDEVDAIARKLRAMKIKCEGPRLWAEYAADYYAVFFEDPDGIRLEVMNYLKRRKLVRRVWDELEGFVNPVNRLMRRRASNTRRTARGPSLRSG